jgi:hypothetical protein
MNQIPVWVYDIVQQVATLHGRKGLPVVKWRTVDRKYSSGYFHPARSSYVGFHGSARRYRYSTKPSFISITAGNDVADQELVLLHELSHWLNPRTSHTMRFWRTAFDLYEKFGITNLQREFRYKQKASLAYWKLQGW